jgi:hypothetical protein
MQAKEIIDFVKQRIEPLPPQGPYGERYRVSATLTDGTFLPCVVVESSTRQLQLAIRRFEESRTAKHPSMGYEAIVQSFVTKGNSVNDYDIKELTPSQWAIPLAKLREIGGETSMGWTEFYGIMRDGMEFRFGTTFLVEFFELPQGYAATDIVKVIPAIRGAPPRQDRIFREKPFFVCYVDGL